MSNVSTVNPICSSSSICVQWLNPAAFAQNATGTYRDLGRNAVRGAGFFTLDLALSLLPLP